MEEQREQLARDLQRSNAELERFAYAVAHDLQNPIHTVKSFVGLLSRNLQTQISPEDDEVLTLINEAAGNMQHLVQSLLEYALAGRGALRREYLPMSQILASIQADLAGMIAETGTRIEVGTLPILSADRTQLKQVLQNLIANAIRYRSEKAPRIKVSGETTNEGWVVSVSDNGQGIAPEYQERIFELLCRLHGSDVPGSGIGLALCRTIVERHGGRIWAASNASGCGTTFHFTISAMQEALAGSESRFASNGK